MCQRPSAIPFAESGFIRHLAEAGERQGIRILVFDPITWNKESGLVRGWQWSSGRWVRVMKHAPTVLYDRAWPSNPEERERYREGLRNMLTSGSFKLLNGRLPGKIEVLQALSNCPALVPILTPSALYRGTASLASWLQEQGGSAFLKPSHGSQGRRVIAMTSEAGGNLVLRGRNQDNRKFRISGLPRADALRRIRRWIGGRVYLMQPLLDLHGADGEPFDVRVLMQKDGTGQWKEAGTAVRAGEPSSVTANLHGGGTAIHPLVYLTARFGKEAAEDLLNQLRSASKAVVCELERQYGRFGELGLDYGIDSECRIWFLEANTKPGRASMACVGNSAVKHAAERPLAYARYILLRSFGRVCHEFDPV